MTDKKIGRYILQLDDEFEYQFKDNCTVCAINIWAQSSNHACKVSQIMISNAIAHC